MKIANKVLIERKKEFLNELLKYKKIGQDQLHEMMIYYLKHETASWRGVVINQLIKDRIGVKVYPQNNMFPNSFYFFKINKNMIKKLLENL